VAAFCSRIGRAPRRAVSRPARHRPDRWRTRVTGHDTPSGFRREPPAVRPLQRTASVWNAGGFRPHGDPRVVPSDRRRKEGSPRHRPRRPRDSPTGGLPQRGDLAFGPDGFLYVGIGAGGGGGGGGQDVTTDVLGSVLRLDVDDRTADRAYAVPDDNPLVGRTGLDEYYAWGFRNPWRLSFDDGDCFVADVGESDYEEVNRLEKGGNYGWNVREGTHCYREDTCPDRSAERNGGGEPFRDPIIEYPHPPTESAVSGVSVIGGYVYRGSTLPALEGAYVFGDFLPEGRLFAATRPDDGDGLWPTTVLEIDGETSLERLLSFGRDDEGEVYALGTATGGGGVFRVVPTE